ncbi:MAG: carbohydrate porin [Planctomycetes bacterium]|nr:carbohydrate porin [Planctomycetota bacterium]
MPEVGDLRRQWHDAGYTLEAYLTVDSSAHPSGGADAGSTAMRALLDVVLSIDSARAMGYEGGKWVVGVQGITGDNGSGEVGVLQNYSNIDAVEDRLQINRLWYQHSWHEGETLVRIGKIDANSMFAGSVNASHFIHSSMGYSPTILGLPTYPDPAFGAAVEHKLTSALSVSAGLFDGAGRAGVKTGLHGLGSTFERPGDAFMIAQGTYAWQDAETPVGNVSIGAWKHTGNFARFDGGTDDGTSGFYSVIEQRIDVDGRALNTFMQLGTADGDVAPIKNHVGLGLTTSDLFLPQYHDTLGLGVSWGETSSASGAGFTASSETAIELFYGAQLVPGVRIKPDIQYIRNPGGDSSLDDAWVLTLRMTVSL